MCVQSTYTREIEVFTMFTVNFRFEYIFENKIDFTVKDMLAKHFFKKEINCKKSYSMWKKTFTTIHQLSCFVGHPVSII